MHLPPFTVRVASVLLGAIAGVAAPTPAVASPPPVPALDWSVCGQHRECAEAQVPLDHDHPRGATVTLSLVKVPAGDPDRRIGTVFVNPGGPGSAGADFVRDFGDELFTPEVRERFDIVGFDPRGVGASTPVRCFDSIAEQQAFLGALPPFPVGGAERRTYAEAMRELGSRCRERNGALLDHVSTANAARDLELLRAAVGDRGLTYAGYSYGALLGLTYADLYPRRVRALMLDGPVDPVAWTVGRTPAERRLPFSLRVGSHRASEDALGVFLAACQDATENCALAAPDTRARLDGLLAAILAAGRVTADTPIGPLDVSYADVVDALKGALTAPGAWSLIAEILDALEAAVPVRAERAPVAAGEKEFYDNEDEALLAVACSETGNPRHPAAWDLAARVAERQAPHFGALWTYLSQACATWPGRDRDRHTGPFTRRPAARTLVVATEHDPAAPYAGVQRVVRRLPGARLLTLRGAGHLETNVGSACVRDAVEDYLVGRIVPAAGATCDPDTAPFDR